MSEPINPMPGADRVVFATVRGHTFGLRRPSRADHAEIARRLAGKLSGWSATESEVLNSLDGKFCQWEARFETLLLPQRAANGDLLPMGECAPAHWLEKGPTGSQVISFRNVMPEEFDDVCEAFAHVFEPKKKTAQS